MKKLYLIPLLLAPYLVPAQKTVDLDRYRFTVEYRALPALKIDSSYRTYSVITGTTQLMRPFLENLEPEKSVLVEGWRQLPDNGHIIVEATFGDLLPETISVKERTESSKSRSGQLITRRYFHQEVVYTFSAEARISDYHGTHLRDEVLSNREYKYVYKGPEFTNRVLAEGYFALNSLTITSDLFRQSVQRSLRNLSEKLSNNFGFREVSVNDHMWIIDSRKHPEYAACREAFRVMNDVLFGMDANNPITGAREQLQPAIAYFEKTRKTYGSRSRHDRKIRYMCYYNLAVLYYYLDDPQSMMREANGLVLNDFDPRDGRNLAATATWLKNLFDQHGIYTRHFPINVTTLAGPPAPAGVTAK